MKRLPPDSVVSALTPQHDALTDCLRSMRMEILWWRLATFTTSAAAITALVIKFPVLFVTGFVLVLLLTLVLGGGLFAMHRGDPCMGVADTPDWNPPSTPDPYV